MNYNEQTANAIDEYIRNNSDKIKLAADDPCLKETHIELTQSDGTRKTTKFEVIKLPLNLVFPNVRNGRFRDIYLEEKMRLQSEGYNGLEESDDPESWELDPFDDTQAGIIRSMLLERLEPEAARKLIQAISDEGQRFPGIIVHDGRIMNANRRYAVLHTLSEQSKEPGFIRVTRLPKNTSDKDLHRIEIKEQMGTDFKLDYSPINEVLKVHEVSALGMTASEVADEMAKKEADIKHLQKMYDVALEVLADNGTPNQWPLLKDKFSYLDDLMKQILTDRKKAIWGPINYVKVKQASYKLFWDDDFAHKSFRKIPKIMKQDRIKKNFLDSVQQNEETEEEFSPEQIKEAFDRAASAEKTARDALKPKTILVSIKDSFDSLFDVIDGNPALTKQDSLDLMGEIIKHAEELKKFRDANSGRP